MEDEMGFGNHGEGFMFANVANGALNYKVDNEKKKADFFDGRLTSIELVEDTFEEQPVTKVQLVMEGEDGIKAKIKFTLEAWYSVGFFSRIRKIDLSKPFRLGVMPSENNEKVSFCWMKQQNKKVEADKAGTPQPKKTVIGKKTVFDWTEFDAFAEQVIATVRQNLENPVLPTADQVLDVPKDDLPF